MTSQGPPLIVQRLMGHPVHIPLTFDSETFQCLWHISFYERREIIIFMVEKKGPFKTCF